MSSIGPDLHVGVQTSVDETDPSPSTISASVQTDPSPSTISMSVQVPELALTDVRLGIVQRLETLSSFVSSGGVSFQCFGRCTIHDSSCLWQQYYPVSPPAC